MLLKEVSQLLKTKMIINIMTQEITKNL